MKKIVYLLIFGLFLSLLFTGCKKPIDDDPIEPVILTGTIQPRDISAPLGSVITFDVTSNADWAEIITAEARDTIFNFPGTYTFDYTVRKLGPDQIFCNLHKTGFAVLNLLAEIYGEDTTIVPPPDLATVNLSCAFSEVECGRTVVVYVETSNGIRFESNIPNFSGITGPYEVGPLIDTTTFFVKAFNKDEKSTTGSVTIFVINPLNPTAKDTLLCNYGLWTKNKIEYFLSGKWEKQEGWECILLDDLFEFSFFPIRKAIHYFGDIQCHPDEPAMLECDYYWKGDNIINLDGFDRAVSVFTVDTLILISNEGSFPVRETFVHP